MRALATLSFAFGAGTLLAVYLPFDGWQLYAAGVCALFGLVTALLRSQYHYKRHEVVICFALAASLVYYVAYDGYVANPLRDKCGGEAAFVGTVCDHPFKTGNGTKITLRLDDYRGKVVYYGADDLMGVEPGDRISGNAEWQDAACIHENDITTFTSRGVYALLYARGDAAVEEGTGGLRYLPQEMCRKFQETVAEIWGTGDAGSMVSGILTGDLSGLSDGDYTVMKETGLAHLFAVSGMNCAFLVALVGIFLPPRHRRIGAAVTIAILLFYMCMVGLTPSVVRATIMQIFLLIAPLFLRDSDAPTSLGGALLVILLGNPNAAASVSLQLSFAATLGLVLFAQKFYRSLSALTKPKSRLWKSVWAYLWGSLSVTGAAMLFTTPLTAYYFNNLSLISPLSNLLVVGAVGWGFMASFVTTIIGFFCLPLAQILGLFTTVLMEYSLWISRLLAQVPYHAVYFTSHAMRLWMVLTYAALLGCFLLRSRARTYLYVAGLSVALLVCCQVRERVTYNVGDMTLTALDVGQGLSVTVHSEGTALIDCGSRNSYVHAGTIAADALATNGVRRLDAVVVTHYHADHANGLTTIFARMKVDRLYLPDIEDEYGVREELIAAAEKQGTEILFVEEMTKVDLGSAELTVYPPLGAGDANEQGLSVCAASGEIEAIITGDMAMATERALMKRYDLPDCEVLVVSHHGSAYSTAPDFLEEIRPETAIISVGDNSYGHPTEETMQRLRDAGAEILRTDEQGTITIKVTGGDDYGIE